MDPKYIAEEFDRLQRWLALLEQQLLRYETNSTSLACVIPPTFQTEEKLVPEIIEPTLSLGQHAVVEAIRSYKDLHIIKDLSKKFARQTPGAILLDGHAELLTAQIVSTVEQINQSKNSIKAFITQNYETRNERFQALKEQCPATLTMHLYRNIRVIKDQNIQSMNFTWAVKENLRKVTREQITNQISQAIQDYRGKDPDWITSMLRMQKEVSLIPEGQLRLRREQDRPQPCINITYRDCKKLAQTQVAMPIIVIQEPPPTIKPLPVYQLQERQNRKVRTDKQSRRFLGMLKGNRVEVLE